MQVRAMRGRTDYLYSICLLVDPIVNQLQVASIHLLADLASHLLGAIFLKNR